MRNYVRTHRMGSFSAARLAGTVSLAVIVASMLLSGCAPSASSYKTVAQQNKAKLDKEIHTAETSVGIPDVLLQPIEQKENALTAGMASGADKNGQAAANGYKQLYNQVVGLEKLTPDQVHQRATADLQSFMQALQPVQNQGFVEAQTFQSHYQLAQQELAAATTAKDYFAVDGYIVDQTNAVTQIVTGIPADTVTPGSGEHAGSSRGLDRPATAVRHRRCGLVLGEQCGHTRQCGA